MSTTAEKPSLLPLKLHYFCNGFGGAPIIPFLGVIMSQLGFPGSALGWMFAFNTIIMQFVMPLLAGFMDRNPDKKVSTLRLMVVGYLLAFSLMRFVPPTSQQSSAGSSSSLEVSCVNDELVMSLSSGVDPCLPDKLVKYPNGEMACHVVCSGGFKTAFDVGKASYTNRALTFPLGNSSCATASTFTQCRADCPNDPDLAKILNAAPVDSSLHSVLSEPSFWMMLLLTLTGMTCMFGSGSFFDSLCQQMVEGTGQHFGQQRVFASVGWGTAAMLAGYLVDMASADKLVYDYSPAFNLSLAAFLADFITVTFLMKFPPAAAATVKDKEKSSSSSASTGLFQMLFKGEVIGFFLLCAAIGICMGSLHFYFLLLEDLGHHSSECSDVKALKFLQGLVLAFNCLGETPIFIFSGKLLERFGETRVMQFVLGLYSFRFLFYSQMTSPWQTLFIEIANGGCIALFFPAMMSKAHKLAPEGASNTFVALANMAMGGIGMTMGSMIAGSLFGSVGASKMYLYLGLFCLGACSFSVLVQRGNDKVNSGSDKKDKKKN